MPYVYDIESDGLLEELTKIHCIVIKDKETGTVTRYNDQDNGHPSIEEGVRFLEECDERWGHNILEFDEMAIRKVYPWFSPKGIARDSLVISRLIWTDLKDKDFRYIKKNPSFPKYLIGSHSMAAWGLRLGCPKDDYSERMREQGLDPWAEWNQEMEDYCEQDVLSNLKLIELIQRKNYSEEAIEIEQDVWQIINRQTRHGFKFDKKEATRLYAHLVDRKGELTTELQQVFKPFYVRDGKTVYPKRSMNRQGFGYTKEAPYCKIKQVDFNPNSRDHIANRLQRIHGWKPKQLTNTGKPMIDESTIGGLPFPEIPLLLEFLTIAKRIGQLAEGNEAWLKHERNGRIHGRVNTNGAVTGRMTHNKPNMAQVPAGYSLFGKECRSLFTVASGNKLVGFDADALELRCLAGYMARWDKGEYVSVVLDGKKEDGTDIHTRNQNAIGLKTRDAAKTWFYAFIYGAGDYKLGTIIAADLDMKRVPKNRLITLGRESRARFEANLPALGKLSKAVKAASKKKGWVKGLDGRRIICRSEHSALNTLLQGAGAILMKKFLVILDQALAEKGYRAGADYEFVANVHDEVQIETNERFADEIGKTAEESLIKAGESFNFGCPITGQYAVGNNWSETH